MANKLGNPLHAVTAEKPCARCIGLMVKTPDINCQSAPGYKACVMCKSKATRCFQVPPEHEAEAKALMAAKRDVELDRTSANILRVKVLSEKLYAKLEAVMSQTPSRARKSKDITADGDGSGVESPIRRPTRSGRTKSQTTLRVDDDDDDNNDDNDHIMEDEPLSPRQQPQIKPRNLFGAQDTRRPPVTVSADKPLDVNVVSSSELKLKMDELLQTNTWTMRRTRAMAQSLMNIEGTMTKLVSLFSEDIKLRKEDLALRREELALARAGSERQVLPLRTVEKRQRDEEEGLDGEGIGEEEEDPERKRAKHGENEDEEMVMEGECQGELQQEEVQGQLEEGLEEGEIVEKGNDDASTAAIVTID
ncbi:hypothetical protein AAP_00789 [Ascosphaera apis ARSEF 7405]|uniref:Uncharacterized protein n=1 Tax=Ascosphaera apis ARSEF 7405 TaxID=392613 RepID=A0A168CY39_9EURO|nr:hypothetical protein AAP_00789 [Ascosphaera apis ARSEF 7405]